MKKHFSIPDTAEYRLWRHYSTNSHELITNLQQTVADADIYKGNVSS